MNIWEIVDDVNGCGKAQKRSYFKRWSTTTMMIYLLPGQPKLWNGLVVATIPQISSLFRICSLYRLHIQLQSMNALFHAFPKKQLLSSIICFLKARVTCDRGEFNYATLSFKV
jgi:hypothetical protein